tara:strand:- start:27229 stop:27645 length:417 start_codon:yes stop_codon:yes gene_type:complete
METMTSENTTTLLQAVRWNDQGLVPAVAQDAANGDVLMLAWMNAEALQRTAETGRAVYWSRSRQALWSKGESSGNVQLLRELRLDCDGDTVLLRVEQLGGVACHTGRRHCFYQRWSGDNWEVTDPVLKSPESMYGNTP